MGDEARTGRCRKRQCMTVNIDRRQFLAGTCAALAPLPGASADTPGTLREFFDQSFNEQVQSDPTAATVLHFRTPEGNAHHTWTLRTDRWFDERAQRARQNLERLNELCVGEECGSDDALLYSISQQELLDEARWRRHHVPFHGALAPHLRAPSILIGHQEIGSVADAQAFVERARNIGELLAVETDRMAASIAAGCAPAAFNFSDIDASAGEAAARMVAGDEHPLVLAFTSKCDAARLPVRDRNRLARDLRTIVREELGPAVARFRADLRDVSRSVSANRGVWAIPDGQQFYESEILRHCTLALDPDELHAWGLDETARIQAEVEQVGRNLGYESGERSFLRHLATSPEFYFEDSDEGRARYLAQAKEFIAKISEAPELLTSDRLSVQLQVRPVDPISAATSGRAYYVEPSADGSRPGVFFLNTEKVSEGPAYQLEAVCYHEAIPGHHLQAAAAIELGDRPLFRRQYYVGAFAEGWGLYAEKFPRELGFYTDPYQDAGRLSLELFRAVRVVVDTGIHHRQWSFERALRFMNDHTGNDPGDNLTEVKRYFNWPAQALTYKVGMRHIEMLRERAQQALGQSFSLPDFHAAVLSSGGITLPMLSDRVERFIITGT